MIHMPRRSVTRFFIPLIDVLLLLFCVFLLMSFGTDSDLESEREVASEQSESIAALQDTLRRRTDELQRLDKLRPALEEVGKLKEEVERLRKAGAQPVQERTYFRLLDVDPKTGGLYFYDVTQPEQPRVELPTAKAAHALIARHRREAKGRELYYYILYPRPETGYPTLEQERRYRAWFAGVGNSLQEVRP